MHRSPSDLTESGRSQADHPTGSLGIAISEAVEVAEDGVDGDEGPAELADQLRLREPGDLLAHLSHWHVPKRAHATQLTRLPDRVRRASSRNWLGRIAARKAIAAAEGVQNTEPNTYPLPFFEDTLGNKPLKCDKAAAPESCR